MIEIQGLTKKFGTFTAVDHVDLTIRDGEFFGLLGPNGAGKTTTMKTVLGLLQADDGEIFVAGEKVVYGQTPTNRHIGYLPDVPEDLSGAGRTEH